MTSESHDVLLQNHPLYKECQELQSRIDAAVIKLNTLKSGLLFSVIDIDEIIDCLKGVLHDKD